MIFIPIKTASKEKWNNVFSYPQLIGIENNWHKLQERRLWLGTSDLLRSFSDVIL